MDVLPRFGNQARAPSSSPPPKSILSHSPLRSLPREIRQEIWRYSLRVERTILWPSSRFFTEGCGGRSSQTILSPGLLATCRQIYEEASPVLYQENSFCFRHPSDLNVFRWLMDHNQAHRLTNISLSVREKDLPKIWIPYFTSSDHIRSLTADIPNIRRLHVYLEQRWWHLGQDPLANLNNWHLNRAVRQMCMALEHRTPAVVHVTVFVHVPSNVFETILAEPPDLLEADADGILRTQPVEYFSAFVTLELSTQRGSPMDM